MFTLVTSIYLIKWSIKKKNHKYISPTDCLFLIVTATGMDSFDMVLTGIGGGAPLGDTIGFCCSHLFNSGVDSLLEEELRSGMPGAEWGGGETLVGDSWGNIENKFY